MTNAPHVVHLDHNAGAPVDPRVLAHYLEVERECPGNPASVHSLGRRARAVVEDARERIGKALGAAADDVLFVSGGTEANNLAVRGLGDPTRPVLLAPLEHPSVLEAASVRGSIEWRVDANACAVVEAPALAPGLVALVHAQGEVGSLQPIERAAELARELGVPFHVDAAQTLGRAAVAEAMRLATSVALSPHKCGGLRGAGVLVVRDAARTLRPLLRGGAQEHGLRPGTVSPSLAAATALTVELAVREQPVRAARMAAAIDAFLAALEASGTRFDLLTPRVRLPNTATVRFAGVDGRNLLPAIDLAGVAASHGSACSSGSPQPPRVLLAMGLAEAEARACVRFSAGHELLPQDAAEAARRVAAAVARAQKKN